jgi:uncharacterized protein (TIGR02594 family)
MRKVPHFAGSGRPVALLLGVVCGLLAICPPAMGNPATGRVPTLVSEARKYMGTNPTARKRLWCATFMNMVLAKTGYAGTGSDSARSFASYGKRISEPRVGAIAVLTRGRRGGHVGIVTGIDANGNPIIISGNHGHRVGEGSYPRKRVIAYVMPVERAGRTQLAAATFSHRASDADQDGGLTSPIVELLAAINAERNEERHPQAREAVRPVERAPVRRAVEHPVERAPPVVTPRPAPYRVVQQLASADVPLPRERATPMPPMPRSRPQ